ncbi:acyltransferase [Streptomyces europaeiscabiei]|uniref:acyltransferase n=1 Tax=Streptomyces europaeiscabiei TaxID=146819 RepID=UPI00299FBD1A|nr:acyltransferase [Streptomyces europaeiscabiei]MDX3841255.1 acyltransferase [Streptomyces europaeiscabiei]
MLALSVGLLTLLRETASGDNRLTRELAADAYAVYIVHLPILVTLQYYLADRGLSATAAWSIVSVTAVPTSFLLAAGLRRLPGFRRVL